MSHQKYYEKLITEFGGLEGVLGIANPDNGAIRIVVEDNDAHERVDDFRKKLLDDEDYEALHDVLETLEITL